MKLNEKSYGIIYFTAQLKAAQALLNDTPDFFYRKVCRWYSEKFHTELTKVFDLPYHFILQQYYESSMEKRSYNDIYDYTQSELLETFIDKEEEAAKAFAESLIREQEETLRKKKQKQDKENTNKVNLDKEQSINKEVKIPNFDLKFDENDDENQ